jgi:hypothetical protein
MPEYIERDEIITKINDIAKDYFNDGSIQCAIAAGTVIDIRDSVIMNAPTADVVAVVRCQDCEHNVFSQANSIIHCNRTEKTEFRECDDFCKYGKRKGD